MYRPTLVLLLLLVGFASRANAQDNWAAAACAGLGPKCTRSIAKPSGHCFAGLWMSSQPRSCRKAACDYCSRLNRRSTQQVCRREAIIKHCFKGKGAAPKPKPKPQGNSRSKPKGKGNDGKKKNTNNKNKKPNKPKKNNNNKKNTNKPKPGRGQNRGGPCKVFMGSNNKVVIPTSRLKLNSAWSRNSDGSMTWKRKGGSGIDRAGSGTICARFKVPSSGQYYMTVVSKAPHPTEYNDAWFRLNAGFRLFRPPNSWKKGGSGWFKGYQNDGKNRKANYILTIDFNGHQFISNRLARGREYQVCVSGRSAMYTIYQLIFIKCDGSSRGCNRFNGPIKNAMRSLPPSRC